jgi:hypothetical protein
MGERDNQVGITMKEELQSEWCMGSILPVASDGCVVRALRKTMSGALIRLRRTSPRLLCPKIVFRSQFPTIFQLIRYYPSLLDFHKLTRDILLLSAHSLY